MADVPFIPLLGEDGLRPRVNTHRLANSIAKLIEKHRYGDCEKFSDYDEQSVISKCKARVMKVADQDYGEEHALKKERLISSNHSEKNFCSEVEILRRLSHPNIIAYEGIVGHGKLSRAYILMEYCEQNLSQLYESFNSPFDEPQLKCVMTMLLNGLAYLHEQKIIHRDIAPRNLLISSFGMLKIGDFAKAVQWEDDDELECNVGTSGYRAPELIVGHKQYTPAIDMWSAGCIFSELLLHRPLFFDAYLNFYQFYDIVQLCGTTATSGSKYLSNAISLELLKVETPESYNLVFRNTKPNALNLLKKFFKYDFTQRIKANKFMSEEYFTTEPEASDPTLLQSYINYKKKPFVDGPYISEIVMDQGEAPPAETDVATHEKTDVATHAETNVATHEGTDVAMREVTDVATHAVTDVATHSVTDVAAHAVTREAKHAVTGETTPTITAQEEEDNFSNSLEEGEIPESRPKIKSEY